MEDNKLSNEREQFLKALEEDNSTSFKAGDIIKGKIIQFDDTDVFVDFDYKSEGKLKRSEFDKEPVKGEEIEALIKGIDKGYIILSKAEVDKRKAQEIIDNAVNNDTTVKGVVKEVTKGGFRVSISGFLAFCPFSLIDISKY